jgi:hypothetical protein
MGYNTTLGEFDQYTTNGWVQAPNVVGGFVANLVVTGTTSVTLPTSGTLATTAQATSTGKAIAMSLIFGF